MDSILKYMETVAQPMDILLLGRDSFLGRLIQFAQRVQTNDGKPSLWSHCALYAEDDDILESTIDLEKFEGGRRLDNGVQYNPIERILTYDRIMLIQLPITPIQREVLIKRADRLYKDRLTYSISGLLGSLLSYWIFRWQSNPLQTKHSLYCSAFVALVYEAIQVDFDPHHTARNTSPEMIYQYHCEGIKKIPLRM
jgi:hypothetical protein